MQKDRYEYAAAAIFFIMPDSARLTEMGRYEIVLVLAIFPPATMVTAARNCSLINYALANEWMHFWSNHSDQRHSKDSRTQNTRKGNRRPSAPLAGRFWRTTQPVFRATRLSVIWRRAQSS